MSVQKNKRAFQYLVFLLLVSGASCHAQDATYSVRVLTPEAALKAAQAALARCRADGYQVAVAVVDRSGIPQVMIRDRFAGPHTPDMAASKAWTALTFRTNTASLAAETEAGKPMSGIRHRPGVVAVGGGKMIEGGGSLLGGIGVSGAPGGDRDDACADAGIAAIREAIEL
ncbi:MAG TPA: heme-binding protein [Burkholderiales bacterium]|nr:heme-binding protein [Burkholderiales bacterium]